MRRWTNGPASRTNPLTGELKSIKLIFTNIKTKPKAARIGKRYRAVVPKILVVFSGANLSMRVKPLFVLKRKNGN